LVSCDDIISAAKWTHWGVVTEDTGDTDMSDDDTLYRCNDTNVSDDTSMSNDTNVALQTTQSYVVCSDSVVFFPHNVDRLLSFSCTLWTVSLQSVYYYALHLL